MKVEENGGNSESAHEMRVEIAVLNLMYTHSHIFKTKCNPSGRKNGCGLRQG